ncbi:MAG TPA: PilX N-terminal domain-containing pilus assembly protein [Woeseiaceae bacterium]|nr:PilX N-terminal domain-containing pilus assembly protein [Woeseiaceae bacterium]
MGRQRMTAVGRQRGAILVVALMFLIAITLLTLSSMRASNIGLYMAQNEESRIAAEQAAQALADAIVANPGSTPVYGMQGFTACTAGQTGCDRYDLPAGDPVLEAAVAANHISARVERVGPIFRPPPRVVESSIDKFTSAGFRVTTTYDRMDEGLGRQQVSQGVLVLVPKQ